MLAYFTGQRTLSTSSDCNLVSAPTYHYCGKRNDGTTLQITAYKGWTPHDTKAGLYTWFRLGGFWVGDSNGGGGSSDHQMDVVYGQNSHDFQQGS